MARNKVARRTEATPVETSTAREEVGGASLRRPTRAVYIIMGRGRKIFINKD